MTEKKNYKEMFERLKQDGIIQNVKCKRNTTKQLCESGIVIYRNEKDYDAMNLTDDKINILYIARALSQQVRYNGNCHKAYHTAQHCVEMAQMALICFGDVDLAFAALIHDSSEAFLGDTVTPVKQLLPQEVRQIEDNIEKVIFKKYGIEHMLNNPIIKHLDTNICNSEMTRFLGTEKLKNYKCNIKNKDGKIVECTPMFFEPMIWSEEECYDQFLSWFNYLNYIRENFGDKECLTQIGNHKLK